MRGRHKGLQAAVGGIWAALLVVAPGCQGPVSYKVLDAGKPPAMAQGAFSSQKPSGDGAIRQVAQPGNLKADMLQALSADPSGGTASSSIQHARGEVPVLDTPLPRELTKESLPPYIIEPPDTLQIEGIRIVPLPPYRIEALDALLIQVADALPNQPINGPYYVGPDGTVSLGFSYGAVRVAGLTLDQAAAAIKAQLGRVLKAPQVGVALAQFRGMQQVRGEHLVSMDGTINLGSYGTVYVTGLTVPQAKAAIEKHLSRFLLNPEIALAVSGYNSKVYYVITDGAGYGEQVFRFPVTGNETVLDALSNINGVPPAGSKRYIWLARPAPAHHGCYQILPVDWEVITQAGSTETNYQVFPGDRIYVKADKLIHLDNTIAKILSPIERVFGGALLFNTTIRSFERNRAGTGTTFFPF